VKIHLKRIIQRAGLKTAMCDHTLDLLCNNLNRFRCDETILV